MWSFWVRKSLFLTDSFSPPENRIRKGESKYSQKGTRYQTSQEEGKEYPSDILPPYIPERGEGEDKGTGEKLCAQPVIKVINKRDDRGKRYNTARKEEGYYIHLREYYFYHPH